MHPEDFDLCLKIYMEAFEARLPFEMEYRLRRYDGEWRWLTDRGVPLYDDKHEFIGYIGSCMDITDKKEGQKLREMAQTDGLTQINNRIYFEQLSREQIEKAKQSKQALCLVMIDIDKFKRINDVYGHQAGDAVLKKVAESIKSNIRNQDILGRYGGDEFILLMNDTDYEQALILIKKIENVLEGLTVCYNNNEIRTSASFGLYMMNNEASLENVIAEADKRLYENKMKKYREIL